MTLDELKPGQEGYIVEVKVSGVTGQRLSDMGFVPGTRIKVVRNAPLVDPVELLLRGYQVSVRHSEAKDIEIII